MHTHTHTHMLKCINISLHCKEECMCVCVCEWWLRGFHSLHSLWTMIFFWRLHGRAQLRLWLCNSKGFVAGVLLQAEALSSEWLRIRKTCSRGANPQHDVNSFAKLPEKKGKRGTQGIKSHSRFTTCMNICLPIHTCIHTYTACWPWA